MSVVAVKIEKDKIIIGADSILVNGYTQEKDVFAKLEEVNGMVIGTVGSAREGGLFRIFARTRKPRESSDDGILEFLSDFQDWMNKKTSVSNIANSYVLVYMGNAFLMEGFYIKQINSYTAIGAGEDFALAALYLGKSVEDSIRAACHLSTMCEEPINIIKVPR